MTDLKSLVAHRQTCPAERGQATPAQCSSWYPACAQLVLLEELQALTLPCPVCATSVEILHYFWADESLTELRVSLKCGHEVKIAMALPRVAESGEIAHGMD
jgi:hypothetical protein